MNGPDTHHEGEDLGAPRDVNGLWNPEWAKIAPPLSYRPWRGETRDDAMPTTVAPSDETRVIMRDGVYLNQKEA